MRILHTSDWHLGRLFHGTSLLDEQEQALGRIVDLVTEADVDLVVIAGDLYDRAIPPAEAVDLFDDTLLRLHAAGATVVAISGNHDSAVRVGYADRLLSRLGVTVRGDLTRAAEPVEIPTDDGGEAVVVYPIPYLDPLATAHLARSDDEQDGPDGAPRRFTHHDAMVWATDRARVDLRSRLSRGPARSIVVAHTFLTGGNPTESERELTLGHVEQVRLDVFDGFDYVALGHLHQGQAFDGGRVAYSGTPLPYSFSEQHHTKAVRIIDLAPDGSLQVEVVPVGVDRPLRTLRGELQTLLSDPTLRDAEQAWVRAELTDPHLPLQAMARLRQRFPHAVELLHDPPLDDTRPRAAHTGDHVRRTEPIELCVEFLHEQRGVRPDSEDEALLLEAFAAARAGGDR